MGPNRYLQILKALFESPGVSWGLVEDKQLLREVVLLFDPHSFSGPSSFLLLAESAYHEKVSHRKPPLPLGAQELRGLETYYFWGPD